MFDCPVCQQLLFEPITTSCGHTFCKSCALRSVDHDNKCPMCRSVIVITPEFGIAALLQQIIRQNFPEQYEQRKQEVHKELEAQKFNVPLFLLGELTLFPTAQLPLHVFEPRYRLMIRRCLEGSKRFGVVPILDNGHLCETGTTALITDQHIFPDGRSLISSTGDSRFKIKSLFEQDGYKVAKVEYIKDDPMPQDQQKLKEIDDKFQKALELINAKFTTELKKIEEKFGKMPSNVSDFTWWAGSILPISTEEKVGFLESVSVVQRLTMVITHLSTFEESSCVIQ